MEAYGIIQVITGCPTKLLHLKYILQLIQIEMSNKTNYRNWALHCDLQYLQMLSSFVFQRQAMIA